MSCLLFSLWVKVGGLVVAIGGSLWVAVGGSILMSDKSHEGKDPADIFNQIVLNIIAWPGLVVVGVIALVLIAVLVTFTIVLLVGLHKNKRGYVKAFLIYDTIFIPLLIGCFVASLSNTVHAVHVISGIVVILVEVYFLLTIRSQYLTMADSGQCHEVHYTA